jgi:hypothetical protein
VPPGPLDAAEPFVFLAEGHPHDPCGIRSPFFHPPLDARGRAGKANAGAAGGGRLWLVLPPTDHSRRGHRDSPGRLEPPHAALVRLQIEHQGDWTLGSSKGLLIVSGAVEHNIQRDDPALVVQSIRHVLAHSSPSVR